jgi:hypothetical protein
MKIIEVVRQGLGNTCMNLNPSGDLLSVGSSSGVIYLYEKGDKIGKIHK